MAPSVDAAWARLDPAQMRDTLPQFTALVAALVRHYSPAAATLAVRSYLADRASAGVHAPFTPRPAGPPPLEQISRSVSWATRTLWAPNPDVAAAKTQVEGVVDKLVLDVGRATVLDNVQRDRQAKAWARVPEPGCCAFCALLATRGAVYKADTVDFKTHDHCRCHVEPVFGAYEPTAQIRGWQSLYSEATSGVHGMKNLQKAWRAAFDARA